MKRFKKTWELVFLTVFIVFCYGNTCAQPASVSWYLSSDQKVSETVGPIIGQDQILSGMEINSYNTVNGSSEGFSQITTIIGGLWTASTNQDNNRYIQFALTPKAGITFNIDTVSMFYGGKGGGLMKANIAYSTDSNFVISTQLNPIGKPVAVSVTAGIVELIKYNPNIELNYGKILYLRIYPWYTNTATGKFVCLQNVAISGTTTGEVIPVIPIVSTTPVTDVSLTTALCGGIVTFDGEAEVSERGVCWNTTGNPTISDFKTIDGAGLGTFTSYITGLSSNTKYYVRAYATNIVGTSYGDQDSLTALSELSIPTIITTEKVKVVGTSATFKNNITDWGGSEIIERGVCYNTSGNPTINDNKVIEGTGSGVFTTVLYGLPSNTKFFARPFATNSQGTGYGVVQEFNILSKLKGTYADGVHLDTDAIQAAIDSCTNAGGGIVHFTNGIYFTSPFELKSNVTLEVDSTATILASQNRYDYYPVGFDTTGGKTPTSWRPFITSNYADNIKITGYGIIDGNGQPWWDEFRMAPAGTLDLRPWLIVLKRANHIVVENITLRNSPKFHLAPQWSRDVRINNVKILAPENAPNTDGIDPATCHNVRITNCFIDVGDDNVAIKSGSKDPSDPNAASSDIVIADCTFLHGHGVSIGSETNGGVDSMLVTNCTFDGTDNGIRIKSNRTRGGNVRGVTYSNLTMKNVRYPILFSEYYPDIPAQNDPAQPITSTTPYYHDITVENLTATNCTYGGLIIGLPETPMTNISLKNVTISALTGLKIRNATVDTINTTVNATLGSPYILEVNGKLKSGTTSVEDKVIPTVFSLSQNYPNPFNPETTIKYSIAPPNLPKGEASQHVTLKVYDILGNEVTTLVNKEQTAGNYSANFKAKNLSSGIYFYTLKAGGYFQCKKMLLLK